MNVLISLTDLKALAARAAAVVPDKATPAVLGCAVLAANGDGIDVTATDKANTYMGRVMCNVVTPGTVAVSARDLLGAAKNLPDGPVRMSVPKDGRILIESGRSKVTLSTNPDEYPMPVRPDTSRTLTLPAADLARIIDDVMASMASDGDKYGLSGAKAEYDGRMLRLVSTDGNRLTWSETEATGDDIGPRAFIPRRGLAEMRKLLDANGDVTLAFGDRAVVASVGTNTLHMRLGESQFPDYRQVIPTSYKRRLLVDREELLTAARRVAYIGPSIKVVIASDGKVTLSTFAVDRGESVAEVDGDLTGEPLTIGFMAPILIDALSTMGGDRALLQLGDALTPGCLTDPDYPTALWIVMPARLA